MSSCRSAPEMPQARHLPPRSTIRRRPPRFGQLRRAGAPVVPSAQAFAKRRVRQERREGTGHALGAGPAEGDQVAARRPVERVELEEAEGPWPLQAATLAGASGAADHSLTRPVAHPQRHPPMIADKANGRLLSASNRPRRRFSGGGATPVSAAAAVHGTEGATAFGRRCGPVAPSARDRKCGREGRSPALIAA